MIVVAGTVAPGAPEVIESWDIDRIFTSARQSTMDDYLIYTAGPYADSEYAKLMSSIRVPTDAFYLAGVREDGYREYKFAADARDWLPEREASVDLRRPVPVLG
jgi:hypothetical protein